MNTTRQHRSTFFAAALAAAVSAAPAVPAFAAPQMTPGMWEYTVKVEMPGMNMPGNTVKQCYTPADVADSRKALPVDKHCDVSDMKTEGNTVSWKMRCGGPQAMSGSGTMTLEPTRTSGIIKMSTQGMNMTEHIEGKRIGDCAK